jgi:hypothetical protein
MTELLLGGKDLGGFIGIDHRGEGFLAGMAAQDAGQAVPGIIAGHHAVHGRAEAGVVDAFVQERSLPVPELGKDGARMLAAHGLGVIP